MKVKAAARLVREERLNDVYLRLGTHGKEMMPLSQESNNHKLVFIGGLHRSGTSLLHKCLTDHPLISGFTNSGVPEDEGQHLQSVYPPAKSLGGPGRFGFNRFAYMNEKSPLVSEVNAQRLFTEWSEHWNLDKPFLMEKSPPNLIRTRFLQALFPSSHFVILLRHPIAVSFATRKLTLPSHGGSPSLHSLIRHWLVCYERFYNEDRSRLNNIFTLKYEDFVYDPQTSLNSIFSFLGIPPISLSRSVRSNVNDKYLYKWRQLHDKYPLRARYIQARYEHRINAFGYSFKEALHASLT